MGIVFIKKINVSAKDGIEFLDNDVSKKKIDEISKIDKNNNLKDDKLEFSDKDRKILQDTQIKKKENKLSKIN